MSRPPDPLQRHSNRTWRPDLANQIHGADIDPQLERCGRDHGPQFAVFQALFGLKPQIA